MIMHTIVFPNKRDKSEDLLRYSPMSVLGLFSILFGLEVVFFILPNQAACNLLCPLSLLKCFELSPFTFPLGRSLEILSSIRSPWPVHGSFRFSI